MLNIELNINYISYNYKMYSRFMYRLSVASYLAIGLPVSYLETRKLAKYIHNELNDFSDLSYLVTGGISVPTDYRDDNSSFFVDLIFAVDNFINYAI